MDEPQEQTKIALTVPNSLLAIIGNENLYYFDKIKKKKIKKLFGGFLIRKIAITNLAIYNLDRDVTKARIKIEDIYGITYSTSSTEFAIHFNENNFDYLYNSVNRDEIIMLLQKIYKKLKNQDILFSLKADKDLEKYIVRKTERKNNPHLFKFDKSNLIPINEYFKSLKGATKEDEKIMKTININNQTNNQKNILEGLDKKEENIKKIINLKDQMNNDLKDIKNIKIKSLAENIQKENKNLRIIVSAEEPKDLLTVYFISCDQTLRCAVICNSSDIFNCVVNKLFEKEPIFKENFNYFLCNGTRVNEYKSLKENGIENESHIILNNYDL